jgi:translocation and assembly module TamB
MNRPVRIALFSLGSIVVLALAVVVSALLIARSDWLREKMRAAIVEQAETAIGGRVEIRKFDLDWTGLVASVDGFVLHGTEPTGQAPLIAIDHATVSFKIISLFSRSFQLNKVEVDRPRVHLIVDANGGTNLPRPKVPSNTRTVDAILNLKIAGVTIRNGEALVELPGIPPKIYPWNASARNLQVAATYDRTHDRYTGDVSLDGYGPFNASIKASAAMERNRVTVSKAMVKTEGSEADFSGMNIGSFADPVVTSDYQVKASSAEVIKILKWKLPVTGQLEVGGKLRYVSPTNFEATGAFHGTGMTYQKVRNIRVSGNATATATKLTLTGVRLNALGGEAVGTAEATNYDAYHLSGKVSNLAIKEVTSTPYDGLVSGSGEVRGRLTNTNLYDASAELTLSPAPTGPPVHGEISAHYTGELAKLDLGHSWVELPSTRIDANGTLGGALTVKMTSHDLSDFGPVLNGRAMPFTLKDGSVAFDGTVTGALDNPQVKGRAEIHNAIYQGKLIDSVSGDLTASSSQLSSNDLAIAYAGMNATGNGSLALTDWDTTDASAISANVTASNLDIPHALEIAGYKNVEVTGALSATAHVSGTLAQPAGTADVTLSKGLIYQQPYDSVTSHVQYVNADKQTASGTFVSGPKRVTFEGTYASTGMLEVSASSNVMALNQIALIRQRQPDIQGNAQFNGSATLRLTPKVELVRLDADGLATGIGLAGRDLGDSHFSARTQGTTLRATFDSNAAKANIKGQATVNLTGDDHATGSITFSNAGIASLASLISQTPITFDGSLEGQADFSGPLFTPKQMSATATIQQIEVHPLPGTPLTKSIPNFSLRNNGPVKVSFANSVIHLDSARFQAPETDITLSGTADVSNSAPLNVRLQGDAGMAILRNFIPDLAASGTINVNGTVRGSFNSPDLSGRATIRNGEFHYADFANGLTNATGEIVFSGTRAQIQSFSADTGGGKFTGSGFATFDAGAVDFQFAAKTRDVRLRYPQGMSSTSDSDIQLIRNSQRSSISGTITVRRLVFNPQQDTATMLADISRNAITPPSGDNSLAGMNLDIQIQTAPDVALQSKVADSIQGDATLRLRGTVANPALLANQYYAGQRVVLREQIHDFARVDFVFQPDGDCSDSRRRFADSRSRCRCDADGDGSAFASRDDVSFGSAARVFRYRGFACDGANAGRSVAGAARECSYAEFRAAWRFDFDWADSRESGGGAFAAILRCEPDQDRSAVCRCGWNSGCAPHRRTAGDARYFAHLHYRRFEYEPAADSRGVGV